MNKHSTGSAKPGPFGNIVIKVENYDTSVTRLHCYPGMIEGTAAGGLLDGKKIIIALRKTPSNEKVSKVSEIY